MIKANELRLGNLIDRVDYICKVISIGQDGIITEPINYHSERFVVQEIKPIELTVDVLLKCGFTFDNSLQIYEMPNEKNFISYQLQGNLFVPFDDFYNAFMPKIKYLHQLQNLYFIITGEELEINL